MQYAQIEAPKLILCNKYYTVTLCRYR